MKRKIATFGGYFEAFIETLSAKELFKLDYILSLLESQDRMPSKFIKYIREELYELRMNYEGKIFRIFFIFDGNNIVLLFNGFQKKAQKTPQREIEQALKIKKNIMHKNDYKIRSYSDVLAQKYGAHGTPERTKFDEEAYAFYTGQVILDARKGEKMTQKELADKLGVNKSYISKIENGVINPSVGLFYRIINALGLQVEITKTVG